VDFHEFRFNMNAFRSAAERDAASLRSSQRVLNELHNLYQKFDAAERVLANRVITEWLESDDENLRFDALAMVDDFAVTNAAGALTALATRLRASTLPGAPYELQKVERILRSLTAGA
jgi:hypothetical protein